MQCIEHQEDIEHQESSDEGHQESTDEEQQHSADEEHQYSAIEDEDPSVYELTYSIQLWTSESSLWISLVNLNSLIKNFPKEKKRRSKEMRKRARGGEYRKATLGELVSPKEYITNNFPDNGAYCIQCE